MKNNPFGKINLRKIDLSSLRMIRLHPLLPIGAFLLAAILCMISEAAGSTVLSACFSLILGIVSLAASLQHCRRYVTWMKIASLAMSALLLIYAVSAFSRGGDAPAPVEQREDGRPTFSFNLDQLPTAGGASGEQNIITPTPVPDAGKSTGTLCFFCNQTGRCDICGGDGEVEALAGSVWGTACTGCNGSGVCPACRGDGVMGN